MSATKLAIVALGAALSMSSQAALHDRGGGLIYDDVLNVTWIRDSNLAHSTTFGIAEINPYGRMSWDTAKRWIDAMNAASYLGFNNWRLPKNTYCLGFACPNSEMGHLFYEDLGGQSTFSISTRHNSNYTVFPVEANQFWSETEYEGDNRRAYLFNFSYGGNQQECNKNCGGIGALVVRDGDVAAVPEPETQALFLAGLGLLGVATRRKAKLNS